MRFEWDEHRKRFSQPVHNAPFPNDNQSCKKVKHKELNFTSVSDRSFAMAAGRWDVSYCPNQTILHKYKHTQNHSTRTAVRKTPGQVPQFPIRQNLKGVSGAPSSKYIQQRSLTLFLRALFPATNISDPQNSRLEAHEARLNRRHISETKHTIIPIVYTCIIGHLV